MFIPSKFLIASTFSVFALATGLAVADGSQKNACPPNALAICRDGSAFSDKATLPTPVPARFSFAQLTLPLLPAHSLFL
jgi:hypothetical protein